MSIRLPALRLVALSGALVAFSLLAARAQDASPAPEQKSETAAKPTDQRPGDQRPTAGGPRRGGGTAPEAGSSAEQHRLPPDATTRHTLALPGRTLNFTATAGSIRLFDDKGEPQAEIATTAYVLDGAEPRTRPVTFVFNGGPGASSAWQQLGASGPWRLPFGTSASDTPALQPNAETWLDFTDLVFIDPVGTGYSRFIATGEDVRRRFWSVDGDAASVAVTIRRWLEKSDRLLSPKFIAGESYGGIRGPKVVHELQTEQGVGIKGLILISPLFDFREFSGSSQLQFVASLPSMAAVARQAKGPVTRADMADVETYARGDYLLDLIRGMADTAATNRLADRVAALTGIDPAVSRRLAGRFDSSEFRREFDRQNGRVAGRYDASLSAPDPYPDSSSYRFGDPSADPLLAPLTSAVVDLTRGKLNWRPDGSYQLLNGAVGGGWNFGRGRNPVESASQLREMLALDPKMKLLVVHGLFDLATPYFGSRMVLDQLPPALTSLDRVKFAVYPGGHMVYARDPARQALRAEAEAMMK